MGMQDAYQTQLSAEEEAHFQQWRAALPHDLQNMDDYDLRGAWRENFRAAANGHLGDKYKMPNHMTFSNESQYSNAQHAGGSWADATPTTMSDAAKRWVYWATPFNMTQHSGQEMGSYFRQYEPNSTVVLPYNYKLPAR